MKKEVYNKDNIHELSFYIQFENIVYTLDMINRKISWVKENTSHKRFLSSEDIEMHINNLNSGYHGTCITPKYKIIISEVILNLEVNYKIFN